MHMTMRLLSIIPLLVVPALVFWPVKSSHAASASCAMLQRQLANTPNSNSVSQRNGPLIQRQARQLQQMRAKANAQGCGGFLFSRGETAVCKRYTQALQAMSARLAKLQKASDRSGAAQPSRQQILASLEAKGCNDRVASADRKDNAPGIQRRTLLEVLFGGTRSHEPTASAPKAMLKRQLDAREAHRRRSAGPETLAATYEGTEPSVNGIVKKGYRTLCVRTCDGYYFPISFSTKPKYFARDQNACSAMCPAGNAKLYFHAVPEQESDAMISVADRRPYTDLPNAFNYRTAGVRAVPGCTCHARSEITAAVPNTSDPQSESVNTPGKPGEAQIDAQPQEPEQGDAGENEIARRDVRIVGPAFFPNETDATDFAAKPREEDVQESRASILTPENIVETIASDIIRRIQ
ncbi:DUF2865 domain-containing protein [Phyllobacterium endophyticum]|nr:DUF2865 domain-containing protein [Phyllobacterium endophyticum]